MIGKLSPCGNPGRSVRAAPRALPERPEDHVVAEAGERREPLRSI